jgi:signal transduction histidine kinase
MRAFFRDPKVLAHVKEHQKKYFIGLTEGRTDEAYFENRLQVGDTHQRIELLPQWYLGLYSRYFQLIIEQMTDRIGPEETLQVLPSITKQIFLDIGLAIDAYIQGGFIDKLRAERHASAELREELARKEKLAILGQLAGSVGHELRNPLAAMHASIYFLKIALEEEGPKIEKHVRILERELTAANEIITNLLDFSRVREPQRSVVSSVAIVNDVLDRHDLRGVTLIRDLDDVQLMIDPNQMMQVIGNLVMNAIQAMPDGGNLTVRSNANGDRAHISVSDTGSGIAPGLIQKIFQPLFTTKAQGIGLGLAVCDSLVRANAGSIDVKSTPGQGSTFTLYLPKANI